MDSFISGWIIGISSIAVIAVIAESILPDGGLKKFAMMAVGLIVLCMVIAPPAKLLSGNIKIEDYLPGTPNEAVLTEENNNKSHKDYSFEVYTRQTTNNIDND